MMMRDDKQLGRILSDDKTVQRIILDMIKDTLMRSTSFILNVKIWARKRKCYWTGNYN